MRRKFKSKFSFPEINKLRESFKKKGWTKIQQFELFFENYCSFLEDLNSEQSQLVHKMTKEFLWITDMHYHKHLVEVLKKLAQYKNLNFDKVFVVPIFSQKDRENSKPKSSTKVAYDCQSTLLKFTSPFKETKFQIINNLENLPKVELIERFSYPIILIDDFIGTGESAITALKEMIAVRNYSNKHLIVTSLVCQEEGKNKIEKLGFNILYNILRFKGLDDFYEGKELKKNKDIMTSIEDILSEDEKFFRDDYSFGYKNSQALVSMTRTPNNTFPLYWFKANLKEGKKWKAPFPR